MFGVLLILFFIALSPAIANEHYEHISHHWASPVYIMELRYQLVYMISITAAALTYKLMMRLLGEGR